MQSSFPTVIGLKSAFEAGLRSLLQKPDREYQVALPRRISEVGAWQVAVLSASSCASTWVKCARCKLYHHHYQPHGNQPQSRGEAPEHIAAVLLLIAEITVQKAASLVRGRRWCRSASAHVARLCVIALWGDVI